MAHHTSETTLTAEEQNLAELFRQADDYFKIELLRPAKTYYQRALSLDPKNAKAKQRITECDRLLAYEMKVMWILVIVTAVLVVGYLLIRA
jgi:hypothetical protein